MDSISRKLNIIPPKRDGFVLPAVIFALLIMSAVAVASLVTADDEHRSARAVKESGGAFYAAEAGINRVWRTWDDDAVQNLAPGQTLDLGWQTLNNGGRYHAEVQRVDNGGQRLYQVAVNGRGRGEGAAGGRRTLRLSLTEADVALYNRSASVVRGKVEFGADNRAWGPGCGWGCRTNGEAWIDGTDQAPSTWDAAACADHDFEDGNALMIKEQDDLDTNPQNDGLHQDPYPASESIDEPIIEMPIGDEMFQEFAGRSLQELIDMADHTFPEWTSWEELGANRNTTHPTVNADGTCNTDDPYNWGSKDSSHPCYDYHPIIYLPEGAEIRGLAPDGSCGYGQAVVIAEGALKLGHHDCDGGKSGTDPNEDPYEFAGVAIVKGCLEIVYSTQFYGTAIVDDDMSNSVNTDCDVSGDFDGNGLIANMNATYHFSSCAVDKALQANGWDVDSGLFARLNYRSFSEPLR